MATIATIVCVLGIIALIWGVMQKMKAARLNAAPFAKTGDVAQKGDSVAGPKGAISVEGDVRCPAPLLSPVTGTPCVYYELKVTGEWKDGDSTKSKEYVSEKRAAAFSLDDGSGEVRIVAEQGGDFDALEKIFDETKKEGFFADLKNAIGKGKPIEFGKYAFENPVNSKADKFTCTEHVLKVSPRMFALGKYADGAITSPAWRSLLLSNQSRDSLFGAAEKAAKQFIMGGAGALALGVILGVVSTLTAKPAGAETAAAESSVAVQAANPAAAAPSAAGAERTVSAVCKKTKACCEALNGAGFQNCKAYDIAPEEGCAASLPGFKTAVQQAKPDLVSACE